MVQAIRVGREGVGADCHGVMTAQNEWGSGAGWWQALGSGGGGGGESIIPVHNQAATLEDTEDSYWAQRERRR